MKLSILALAIAGVLASAGAIAQSKGEANYDEQCRRPAAKGTAAEQAATRQRCIEDAKKAAKTDVPGAADQPGTSVTGPRASAAEQKAAREKRQAVGAQVAKQPKQDPKQPSN